MIDEDHLALHDWMNEALVILDTTARGGAGNINV